LDIRSIEETQSRHNAVTELLRLGYTLEGTTWFSPSNRKPQLPLTVEDIGIILFKMLRPHYEDPMEDVYHDTCGGFRDYLPHDLVGTRDPEGHKLTQWPKTPAWKYYYGNVADTIHRKVYPARRKC
jgi:hypothetical protein